MSALPPKADIRQRIEHVCFVPKADIGLWCFLPPFLSAGRFSIFEARPTLVAWASLQPAPESSRNRSRLGAPASAGAPLRYRLVSFN
jgi:hypothetical protein